MKVKYPIGGYAPGHYMSKCVSCEEEFMGDKYARQKELHKLRTALDKIKFSNDTINEVLGK